MVIVGAAAGKRAAPAAEGHRRHRLLAGAAGIFTDYFDNNRPRRVRAYQPPQREIEREREREITVLPFLKSIYIYRIFPYLPVRSFACGAITTIASKARLFAVTTAKCKTITMHESWTRGLQESALITPFSPQQIEVTLHRHHHQPAAAVHHPVQITGFIAPRSSPPPNQPGHISADHPGPIINNTRAGKSTGAATPHLHVPSLRQ